MPPNFCRASFVAPSSATERLARAFWFDRGVDGFRIDVLHHLIEDGQFRDNPPNPEFEPGMRPSHALLRVHTVDQPEIQAIITGLRKVADDSHVGRHG